MPELNSGKIPKTQAPQRVKATRGGLAGPFLRLMGFRYFGLELKDESIALSARNTECIGFADLTGPVQATSTLGFATVEFPLKAKQTRKVVGLKRSDAKAVESAINTAWLTYFAKKLEAHNDEIQTLAEVVSRLERPSRYPSACLLEPFHKRAVRLLESLPDNIPNGVLSTSQQADLDQVGTFRDRPQEMRQAAIESFTASEQEAMRDFFDTIESNPLTPEQRLAVTTDEDATLVLAGAGSGKTSVIVAKAAHLIQRQIRQPEEILLMAFGKDAATEMATRIEERAGAKVDALTFHALGNSIIRQVENGAPALAPHASDDKQYMALLRDIVFEDIAKHRKLAALLLKWFSELYWPYKSEWDFKTKDQYYQYVEASEFRTFQGELVKSYEECEIANWLYLNGIAYEYEPLYEHDLPENDRTAYTPDFRLTESGVYIEHLGVRKSKDSEGNTILTTASHVNRESYIEGMEWKRKVHEEHDTTLIETYSYERVEDRLTEALEEKLAPHATPNPIPPEKIFEKLAEIGQMDAFTQVLGTFLRHYKSAGTTLEECRKRARKTKDSARSLAFLKIFEPLFEAYEKRLGDRIDFEDMIARATEHVKAGRFVSPYRHLLVDEFQDISEGRARLLKALKAQHEDARIFAVGDDWQSIYRFTGSDIHLMRDFADEFGGTFVGKSGVHKSVDLGRTFRSVDKIALPARTFVLQNPSQIAKQVITAGKTNKPAIKVAYYGWAQADSTLNSVLGDINAASSGGEASVLLLGRYNFLEPKTLPHLHQSYPNLSLKFMTVHRSKGLEADHVVILKAASDRMGFPSEIVDDPLLDLVLPKPEQYDHAEERRLFYVALTRAKNSVTILADRQKPSVFVRELVTNPDYEAIELGDPGVAEHRCGACEGRMLAHTSKNGRTYFQCEHRQLCGEMLRPCSECGVDLPVADKAQPDKLICSCGASFPACPDCSDGWFVERKGKWGSFLGCVKYPACKRNKSLSKKKKRKGLTNVT